MSRPMRWLINGLAVIAAVSLLSTLLLGNNLSPLILLAVVAIGSHWAWRLVTGARFRLPGENLLACTLRRGRELKLEAAYARLEHKTRRAGGHQPARHSHAVHLDCSHSVYVWSRRPPVPHDPVDCPYHHSWGPVYPASVMMVLQVPPAEILPTVHRPE